MSFSFLQLVLSAAFGGLVACALQKDPFSREHVLRPELHAVFALDVDDFSIEAGRSGRRGVVEPLIRCLVRPVKSRMVVNDSPSLLAACLSGHGIAQPLELYSREALRAGKLVRILPEWNQEHCPLYAYLPSRRHPPAKVRLF
jgi:DNA-binding transcriptional LysR family regulator